MHQSKYENMPQGYQLIKHSFCEYQWIHESGSVGFKCWDKNLVIYAANKDAEWRSLYKGVVRGAE